VGKEESAARWRCGSNPRAALREWEVEKGPQCFEMGHGAGGGAQKEPAPAEQGFGFGLELLGPLRGRPRRRGEGSPAASPATGPPPAAEPRCLQPPPAACL